MENGKLRRAALIHIATIFPLSLQQGFSLVGVGWHTLVSPFTSAVIYTAVGLSTGQQRQKRGLNKLWATSPSLFRGGEESLAVGLLLLVWEEGQEAWGEVSTFSAYLTFSCLMFRNSTRLSGSQRRGSTQIHGGSAYTNQEEFPTFKVARPLIIWQYITCIISLRSCGDVSLSKQTFSPCWADP